VRGYKLVVFKNKEDKYEHFSFRNSQHHKEALFADRSFFLCFAGNVRSLTSGEAFTALKPFFFAVHPDLFGQFPKERVSV
jgi:hypothetical protein